MQDRRFFAEKTEDGWRVTGEEFRHLCVLRMKSGDVAVLLDGCGTEAECVLTESEKDFARFRELGCRSCAREPRVYIHLFQAVCKGDKNELIVQKAVELGVSEITPFSSEYTVKANVNRERLKRVADEAVKQCRRARRIAVNRTADFGEVVTKLADFDCAVFCNEREEGRFISSALGGLGQRIAVVIGSEGGFSQREADTLSKCAASVCLGRRVLRAETAAICAVSVIMYEAEKQSLTEV